MTRNLDAVGPGCKALNPDVFGIATRDRFSDVPTKADVRAEKELQRLAEHSLSLRNIWYLHLSFRAREMAGVPDLLFTFWRTENGNYPATEPQRTPCAVELKVPGAKLRPEQKTTLRDMKANGWRTYLCRDLDSFLGIFNGTTEEWK